MRSALRAAAVAAAALLALEGCSTASPPLARVGNHVLTVADLEHLARGSEASFPPAPEQARVAALDEMVKRELVLYAARREGRDTTAALREFARKAGDRLLLQALGPQLAPNPDVSEGELRELYARRATDYDVHLVYANDPGVIHLARQALAAGTPFAQVSDHYSTPGLLPPGGGLGAVQPGVLPPLLDEAMRTLRVGQVGGPYVTPDGWFLMLVSSRFPARQDPFDSERGVLANLLRETKARTALRDALLGLESAWHLQFAPDAAQTLFRLLTHARVPSTPRWTPTGSERRRALATYDGGRYTLGDMMADMERNDTQPPQAAILPSLHTWLEGRVLVRIELAEAHRRRLDQDPEVVRELDDAVSNELIQGEANEILASVGAPDEDAARALWASVEGANPMLQQVRVQWLVMRDTTRAGTIERLCAAGRSLRDAARAADPALRVQEGVVRFPARDPEWAPLVDVLLRLQPGQWSGPDFMNDGWHMTQLLDKSVGPVAWEDLTPAVQRSVRSQVAQVASARRFNAYVDSLRRAVAPVLYTENLRRLPWPIPDAVDAER